MLSVFPNLQLAYVLAGVSMNLVSLLRDSRGLGPLTTTQPRRGFISMAIAAGLTLSYFVLPLPLYAAGWLWFCYRLVFRAVIPHFRAFALGENLSRYASKWAAAVAFSINLFGTVVGLLGAAFALIVWGNSV